MNGKCDKYGCQNDAPYHPVLLLYAPKKYHIHDPIKSILSLEICEEHSKTEKLHDFLTSAGWIQICEMLHKAGKILPFRFRTQLAWERIGEFQKLKNEFHV